MLNLLPPSLTGLQARIVAALEALDGGSFRGDAISGPAKAAAA